MSSNLNLNITEEQAGLITMALYEYAEHNTSDTEEAEGFRELADTVTDQIIVQKIEHGKST